MEDKMVLVTMTGPDRAGIIAAVSSCAVIWSDVVQMAVLTLGIVVLGVVAWLDVGIKGGAGGNYQNSPENLPAVVSEGTSDRSSPAGSVVRLKT